MKAEKVARFLMMPPIGKQMWVWAERLREAVPDLDVVIAENDEAAAREISMADGAYGWVSPELLPSALQLRWLQNPYAGPFVGYYYPELLQHPVTVCNPRGIYSDHIAHHILMFMLALARGLPYYLDAQRARRWDPKARKRGYVNLSGATVLIVGVGGIGAETARVCHELGCRVIGIEPRLEHETKAQIFPPEDLDELLPTADFVVTTVPHTPETELMWNTARFRLMKSSAYFINIGRGKTACLDDLVDALQNEDIGGAGLDVFEEEPLPQTHPLWDLENVLLTPHIAVAQAEDLDERRYQLILDNARRFVAGDTLLNVVDKAKWY